MRREKRGKRGDVTVAVERLMRRERYLGVGVGIPLRRLPLSGILATVGQVGIGIGI